MCHCLLNNFFLKKRENLGRSDDAKQRKKGDGLIEGKKEMEGMFLLH